MYWYIVSEVIWQLYHVKLKFISWAFWSDALHQHKISHYTVLGLLSLVELYCITSNNHGMTMQSPMVPIVW